MSKQKITKRFIAGAVCPRCAQMDKLVMYNNGDNQQVRECVSCGYSDIMTDEGPQAMNADELVTRVNQPRPGEETLAHEDEVQVVSIIDSNAGANRRDH